MLLTTFQAFGSAANVIFLFVDGQLSNTNQSIAEKHHNDLLIIDNYNLQLHIIYWVLNNVSVYKSLQMYQVGMVLNYCHLHKNSTSRASYCRLSIITKWCWFRWKESRACCVVSSLSWWNPAFVKAVLHDWDCSSFRGKIRRA